MLSCVSRLRLPLLRAVVALGASAFLLGQALTAVAIELPGLVIKPDRVQTADPMPPGESHALAPFAVINAWLSTIRYRVEFAPADLAEEKDRKAAPVSWLHVDAGTATLDPRKVGLVQVSVQVPADAELGHYVAVVRVVDADHPDGLQDTADLAFDVAPAPKEPGLAGPVIVLSSVSLLFLAGLRVRRQLAS